MEKEGTIRLLTSGEIHLAQKVFRSIQWGKVWVHCGSYLPFGLQGKYVGMTPNGEMYFRKETYQKDFSNTSRSNQHFFIHEMVHVWQKQNGMWVKSRGLFSWASSYKYSLDLNKKLHTYSMSNKLRSLLITFY